MKPTPEPGRVIELPQTPTHDMRLSPSFVGLKAASPRATKAATGASKKSNTKCEQRLRSRLWRLGCRFRVNVPDLPGRPDIVFSKARLIVFCDGDFWHGRNWPERRRKLLAGHNADYWLKKIGGNIARDAHNTQVLQTQGWKVLRFWETDILKDADQAAALILEVLNCEGHRRVAPR